MTTTRRLAAIKAADVAGFSAAMERCEKGTILLRHGRASRSKNGVASLAYVRPSTSTSRKGNKTWMPGTGPGMTK